MTTAWKAARCAACCVLLFASCFVGTAFAAEPLPEHEPAKHGESAAEGGSGLSAAEDDAVPLPEGDASSGEGPDGQSEADGDETIGADDRGHLFIRYASAVRRHELAAGHASNILKLYRNTFVLWQFGLASMEQVQLLKGEYEKAAAELEPLASAREEARAALLGRMTGYETFLQAGAGEREETEGDGQPAKEPQPEQRDGAPYEALRQAIEAAAVAGRDLVGAEVRHQAGILGIEELLAAHQAVRQANLALEDAKDGYVQSLVEHLAGMGERPPRWIDLVWEMHRDDPTLIRDWVDIWHREAVETSGSGPDPADSIRSAADEEIRLLPSPSLAVMSARTEWTRLPAAERNGEAHVPLRAFAESLGWEVAWDAGTGNIIVTRGDERVELLAGTRTAVFNGKELAMDRPPFVIRGHTYVPLSFVSEVLHADVYWNSDLQFGLIIP